jgi:hypothetical protein
VHDTADNVVLGRDELSADDGIGVSTEAEIRLTACGLVQVLLLDVA